MLSAGGSLPLLGGPRQGLQGQTFASPLSVDWFRCPQARGWVPVPRTATEWTVAPASIRAPVPQSLILLTSQSPEGQEAQPGHLPERTLRPVVATEVGPVSQLQSQCPLPYISWTLTDTSHPMTIQDRRGTTVLKAPGSRCGGRGTCSPNLGSPCSHCTSLCTSSYPFPQQGDPHPEPRV